ncbi:hypothetical protein [Streptomyces sp. NPDC001652]|uniref:hypothetical protein n=1 Tax=Streptomyces sp. NPDC001652 TaxID=3154393 RepID=UPI0033246C63
MVTLSRICSAVARLWRRPAPRVDSFDELAPVLTAAAETGAVVTIPGLLGWLGHDAQPASTDLTETFEEYCERISRVAS